MDTENRKPGQPMSEERLQALPATDLVNLLLKGIRTDFGGQKHDGGDDDGPEFAKARVALTRAIRLVPAFQELVQKLSAEEQIVLGAALIAVATDSCRGSRDRIKRAVGEVRRRLVPEFPGVLADYTKSSQSPETILKF